MPKIPVYEPRMRRQIPNVHEVPLSTSHLIPPEESSAMAVFNAATAIPTLIKKLNGSFVRPDEIKPTQKEHINEDAGGGYTNQLRREIVDYAQKDAFAAAKVNPETGPQTPSARLDEYFVSSGASGDNLASMDYAVLRHEMVRAENQTAKQQLLEQFDRSDRAFIQTAGLIKRPETLQAYIDANMAAAALQAQNFGLDRMERQDRHQKIKEAAVAGSIENSLSGGDINAAEAVFNRFQSAFSTSKQDMLKEKLRSKASQRYAREIFNEAKNKYGNGLGRWQEEPAQAFIQEKLARQDEEGRKDIESFIKLERAREQQAADQLQSRSYEKLRSTLTQCREQGIGYEQAEDFLLRGYCSDKDEFRRKQQIVQSYFGRAEHKSSCSAFNTLYRELLNGDAQEKSLDRAFKKEEINAEDYLLLKSRFYGARAGDRPREEQLLAQSLESFCKKEKLSSKEADEVKYAVFSVPGGFEDQLKAAKTIKEIFSL